MKFGLIISNDWELFGDGSGEYFEIQHKPLEALLKVIGERDAKLTLMAEIGQQFAHRALSNRNLWAQEIADAWDEILKSAVREGNDVQMHLHPQWLDAEFKDGKWHLNFNKWAVSSLSAAEMQEVFAKGKSYLEALLRPMTSDYECLAFRAGAYCIQPSMAVIEKLRGVGFLCDTSVVPGMYNPPLVDFRKAWSNIMPWYANAADVNRNCQNENGLLEIPICSYTGTDVPMLRRYVSRDLADLVCFGSRMTKEDGDWLRQRQKIIERRYPVANRPFTSHPIKNRNVIEKVRWIVSKGVGSRRSFPLDYDQLPAKLFAKCVQRIYEGRALKSVRERDVIVPLLVTGHVKNMHNCENIQRIFDEIETSQKKRIVYWTLTEAVKYWRNVFRKDPAITV